MAIAGLVVRLRTIPPGSLDTSTLSSIELAKALRLRQVADQRRSMAARILLREVVGEVLGVLPAQVPLAVEPEGRPIVVGSAWQVSVSHSGGQVAVAVADRPVGIDLERASGVPPSPTLLGRVCTSEERAWLGEQPDELAFLRLWTRKEAVIKASQVPLRVSQFDVLSSDSQGFSLRDLEAAPGYCAALALGSD